MATMVQISWLNNTWRIDSTCGCPNTTGLTNLLVQLHKLVQHLCHIAHPFSDWLGGTVPRQIIQVEAAALSRAVDVRDNKWLVWCWGGRAVLLLLLGWWRHSLVQTTNYQLGVVFEVVYLKKKKFNDMNRNLPFRLEETNKEKLIQK